MAAGERETLLLGALQSAPGELAADLAELGGDARAPLPECDFGDFDARGHSLWFSELDFLTVTKNGLHFSRAPAAPARPARTRRPRPARAPLPPRRAECPPPRALRSPQARS